MSSTESNNDNQFPVLKDIVTPGDESVIKTSRLGLEVIREIEELEKKTENLSPAQINRSITEQQVNQLIDELIDRHLDSMRAELKLVFSELLLKNSSR